MVTVSLVSLPSTYNDNLFFYGETQHLTSIYDNISKPLSNMGIINVCECVSRFDEICY